MNLAALASDPSTSAAELAAAVYSSENTQDLPVVLTLASHEDPQVRQAVASQLPLLADPKTDEVIHTLLKLTRDPSADVRDWACFALGTQCPDVDTPQLRNALAARLKDPDSETRCEALFGLSRRRDPRAYSAVVHALSQNTVWLMEIEAAGALGDPRLHTLVRSHLAGWSNNDVAKVCAALRLTDPDGLGEDLVNGLADWFRIGCPPAPHPEQQWWEIATTLFELAEHRSVELATAIRERLSGEEVALAAFESSVLARDAREHGWN